MGSVQHHQTQARRFLSLARSDLNSADYARAANALARAASHSATAAMFHRGLLSRATRRILTNTLFALAWDGHLSNGAVRTFRQIYQLPGRLAAASPDAARRLCRQARNRVSALIRSVAGAIAGRPVTGRGRRPPRPPWRPAPRSMTEIMALPNYKEIAAAYGLAGSPLARLPDHHTFTPAASLPGPAPVIRPTFPAAATLHPSSCLPSGSAPWNAPSASNSPTPSPSTAEVSLATLKCAKVAKWN